MGRDMAEIIRDWASLNLIALALWVAWVEIRILRRNARQR